MITLFRWRGMLWTRCKMRKEMSLYGVYGTIPKGAWGYRPITNSKERMLRLREAPAGAVVIHSENGESE